MSISKKRWRTTAVTVAITAAAVLHLAGAAPASAVPRLIVVSAVTSSTPAAA
jgi:hypothetical protein